MKNWTYYPTSILFDAMQTIVGWVVGIFASLALGFWLGAMLGSGQFVSPVMSLHFLPLLPWIWLWNPSILIAYAATLTAIWLALHYESILVKLVALVMHFAVWAAVSAWIVDLELMRWMT